ncbi:MAG: phosphatidate cytidylyltransferase, partial [Alphaproteobacteria bacterium]
MAEDRFDALALRCLSAAVLIPVVLAAIWAGGIWLAALLLAVAGLMAKEWVDTCLTRGLDAPPWTASPNPAAVAFLGAVVLAGMTAALGRLLPAFAIIVAGGIAVAALTGLRRRADDVILTLGLAYITIPVISVTWLAHDIDYGTKTLFWVLAVVWATDIGAYLAGNLLGGPKLLPSVSPSKTWSGLLGGLIAAGGLAAAAGGMGFAPLNGRFVTLSVLVSLVAQGGDLLESRLKRHFEVKDFGTIIPGHGGVLDRVDGLLTAFPFVAC